MNLNKPLLLDIEINLIKTRLAFLEFLAKGIESEVKAINTRMAKQEEMIEEQQKLLKNMNKILKKKNKGIEVVTK